MGNRWVSRLEDVTYVDLSVVRVPLQEEGRRVEEWVIGGCVARTELGAMRKKRPVNGYGWFRVEKQSVIRTK